MSKTIDLNCDIGESFGAWKMGDDEAVMPWITSANVACGFHAGDFTTMQQTVALAKKHDVVVGAHVSLPDLQGFGRREMRVSPNEVYAMTLYQIGALEAIARAQGVRVAHVKPHGALYNMAAKDRALADAIAQAVSNAGKELILVGLAGSESIRAAEAAGLRAANEAFADRRYERDGSLVSRNQSDAVFKNPADAVAQAVYIVTSGKVKSRDGDISIRADTLCVHGDRPDAAAFARQLRDALGGAGVTVKAL